MTTITSLGTAGFGAVVLNQAPLEPTQINVFCDQSETFRALANEHPDAAQYLRAIMRMLTKQYVLVGFGMKGRIGVQTLADFARRSDLAQERVESFKKMIERELNACCGECNTFISGPHVLGDRRLQLLTVAFKEFQGRDFTGAVSVAFEANHSDEVALKGTKLQNAINLALSFAPQSAANKPQAASDPALEMIPRVTRYGSVREFAFALVNSTAKKYQCQQVALGIRAGTHMSVIAVSGMDSFKASSPGMVDIQQAMEESLDAAQTILYQSIHRNSKFKSLPVHKQWGTSTRSAVCSIRLMAGDHCVAVLSLRRDADTGFSDTEISELETTLGTFAPGVDLALRGERSLKHHLLESTKDVAKVAFQTKSRKGKAIRYGMLLGFALFALGWMPYRPMNPCVVVPSNLTQSLAPFDMQLSEVFVKAGTRVGKGDLLARFDTRLLELERSKLLSQRNQAEIDVRAALVAGNAASASLSKANAKVFQTQLDSVEQKISLCTLTAPDAGMVVTAELDGKVGQVFAQGTPILSFAPMDSFELEIRVPEDLARHIQPEQQGRFATAADPGHPIGYTIDSISGSAEVINGKNVFVAKAKLAASSDELRQGMEGFASTSTGWRPIPWIVLHRVYEYASSRFWL